MSCKYCEHKEWICTEKEGVFECTRKRGHKGDHVACGGDGYHELRRWKNRTEKEAAE